MNKDYKEEEKTKFNVDIALQEYLHSLFKQATFLQLAENYPLVFKSLNAIKKVLNSEMTEEEREEINSMKVTATEQLQKVYALTNTHKICYDEENGKYYVDLVYGTSARIPPAFCEATEKLNEIFDEWEIALREIGARLGLYFLKKKSGASATAN